MHSANLAEFSTNFLIIIPIYKVFNICAENYVLRYYMRMNSKERLNRSTLLPKPLTGGEVLRSTSALSSMQSRSHYFFRPDEFALLTGREPGSDSAKAALSRLSEKGQIVSVSKQPAGWVIVPPEYSHYGAPPVDWWLHDCVTLIESHYYVGLLSAAKHWGSSHYALQEMQVMLPVPRRPLQAGRTKVVFFTKIDAEKTPVVEISTKVARLRVSTREATLLDLVRYQTKIGGVEAVARVAGDFNKELTTAGLYEALEAMNNISCSQRLGFIFDTLEFRIYANVVESWLHAKPKSLVRLSTGKQADETKQTNFRWYIEYTTADLRHLKEQL